MAHNGSYVEDPDDDAIEFEILRLTPDAALLSDGEVEDWCPLSQIREGNLLTRKHIGTTQPLHIQEWILKDKGWI